MGEIILLKNLNFGFRIRFIFRKVGFGNYGLISGNE